jgi:hypothetical protein
VPKTRRTAARPQLVALEDRVNPAPAFVLSNNTLIPIETEFPTVPRPAVAVTGLGTGESLVGIDFRPQNGQLYGLTTNGADAFRLYAISHRTGAATPLTAAPVTFTSTGTTGAAKTFGFDFNPTVDRIRVVSDTGLNFRMNPNTGQLVDGDPDAAGVQPDGLLNGGATAAQATAYTNSSANVTATTQYTLDVGTDTIFIQNPPNGGTLGSGKGLNVNGKAFDVTAAAGLDITAAVAVSKSGDPAAGTALAILTAGGSTGLYGISLTDGKVALIGNLGAGGAAAQGFAVYPAAAAVPAVGFDGTNLVRFSTAAPGTVTTAKVTGLAVGEVLVGIDYRPATGQLYGLAVDHEADRGTVYVLDPQTGAATVVGSVGTVRYPLELPAPGTPSAVDLPPAAAGYGFDFNPTVDRIRVVTGTGLNFRINPDNGVPVDSSNGLLPVPTPDGKINGATTVVTGATGTAYTNSFAGTTVTTQYTLDPASNSLYIQNPPNAGTQTAGLAVTVDGAALDFDAVNGFDIPATVAVGTSNSAAGGSAFAALTVGGTTQLYAIDLATGAATPLGAGGTGTTPFVGLAVGDGLPLGRPIDLFAVGSGQGLPATVKVYNPDGQARFTLQPYESTFTGGVYVATGDVTGDGVDDIITGTGNGGGPRVRVFDGVTADLVREFFPYEDTFRGGVIVAAGDTNGDGFAEIITGTGVGGGPRVIVFDGVTGAVRDNFFALEDTFRGGVLVAAADVTGDGKAEVITGTGVGGGPRVQAFEVAEVRPQVTDPPRAVFNFFAFESTFRGGVIVGGGDLTGDGFAEVVAGTGPGGGPRVIAVDGKSNGATVIADFFAFDAAVRGGVQVATVDRDADGDADVITGTGPGIPNRVLIYAAGGTVETDLRPFDAPFAGGVFVG